MRGPGECLPGCDSPRLRCTCPPRTSYEKLEYTFAKGVVIVATGVMGGLLVVLARYVYRHWCP